MSSEEELLRDARGCVEADVVAGELLAAACCSILAEVLLQQATSMMAMAAAICLTLMPICMGIAKNSMHWHGITNAPVKVKR